MIRELIMKLLTKKLYQKKQELIRLRWQQANLQAAVDRAKREQHK